MRGLKYISWGDTTGYAIAAKSYVRALLDAGVNITWTPMLCGTREYEPHTSTHWPCLVLGPICNRQIEYDTVLIHTVPEYYPDWIAKEKRPGRRIFGYTVWELERLPDHWPAILNQLDGVIVPCIWNAEVFRNSGVHVPIHVAAHLSQFDDATLISDSDRLGLQQRLGEPRLWQDRFCFYNIGFWSNRKAPYLVLEAYLQAFTVADPVCLIIKTCAKDITLWHRHWRNLFRRRHPSPSLSSTRLANKFPAPPPFVIICDESLSDGELQALHELGDCFVSLTRTEGWGLGAFEAARLGKPVVMTGYGGQLEYLAPELCWLVDYEMVQVIEPTWGANYREDDQWAEPSIAQAAVHMREIFTDSQAAAARGEKLAEKIGKDFSRSATIQALLAALA